MIYSLYVKFIKLHGVAAVMIAHIVASECSGGGKPSVQEILLIPQEEVGIDLKIGERLFPVETVFPSVGQLGFPLGTELNAHVNA